MVSNDVTNSFTSGLNTTDVPAMSGDDAYPGSYNNTQKFEIQIKKIVTYVGAGIAMAGILLTLLSYVGYRKFHIKRPHIIIVNLCICLFLYYLAYIISNHDRQHPGRDDNNLCLFGVITCHFSILAAWFWILVYWVLILVMYQRPMGGHISHFFIKASFPSYGVPIIITIICAVVAHQKEELTVGKYAGPECFVDNMYLYVGLMVPFFLAFIPMAVVFGIIMRGVICDKEVRQKTSNPRKNVKKHFVRLTIITVLLASVLGSSGFSQHKDREVLASMIIFGVTSSILGAALMVLFCLNHEEIRSHWVAVIRGQDSSIRQHSISRNKYEIGSDMSSTRKTSTLTGKGHPSVYIEDFDDERKLSTYKIVAKQDTDMSTLGLIEIPGTPSPARINGANDDKTGGENAKVRRKKSDVTKMRHLTSKNNNDIDKAQMSPTDKVSGFDDLKIKNDSENKISKNRKTRSTSSSAPSPKHRSTKRQNTADDILKHTKSGSPAIGSEMKKTKTSNSSHRLSRFTRKSTSTIDEETVQLTDFN